MAMSLYLTQKKCKISVEVQGQNNKCSSSTILLALGGLFAFTNPGKSLTAQQLEEICIVSFKLNPETNKNVIWSANCELHKKLRL